MASSSSSTLLHSTSASVASCCYFAFCFICLVVTSSQHSINDITKHNGGGGTMSRRGAGRQGNHAEARKNAEVVASEQQQQPHQRRGARSSGEAHHQANSFSHVELANNLYYDVKEYNYRSGIATTTSKSLTFESKLSGDSFALNGSLVFKITKVKCVPEEQNCDVDQYRASVEMNYTLVGIAHVAVDLDYVDLILGADSRMNAERMCFHITNETKVLQDNSSRCPSSQAAASPPTPTTKTTESDTDAKATTTATMTSPTPADCDLSPLVTSHQSWLCPKLNRVPCVELRVSGAHYKIGETICP